MKPCIICGQSNRESLPVPSATTSLLSDGRVYEAPLKKAFCKSCKSITHVNQLSEVEVRRFYGAEYDLTKTPSTFDASRASIYCDVVHSAWTYPTPPMQVLEIGCGAGHVLRLLSQLWGNSKMFGIEPAIQLADEARMQLPTAKIISGFVEDHSAVSLGIKNASFDLIFAVNVLEHSLNPRRFISKCLQFLGKDGRIIMVVPADSPPNIEVLMYDHVVTFSAQSMQEITKDSSVRLVSNSTIKDLPGFKVYCFGRSKEEIYVQNSNAQQLQSLNNYLSQWRSLETRIMNAAYKYKTLNIFGAGEVATAIRAYAPEVWKNISKIIVDDFVGARRFDKPIELLKHQNFDPESVLLLAVNQGSKDQVRPRLQALGSNVIDLFD